MRKFLSKWSTLIIIGIFVLIVLYIIFFTGNDAKTAHYKNGVEVILLDDREYTLINDITSEDAIGSKVSSILSANRAEKCGQIKSMGILVMSTLYRAEGDRDGRYLVDSSGRVYVLSGNADEIKTKIEDGSVFTTFKMDTGTKSLNQLTGLPDDAVAMIENLKKQAADGAEKTEELKTVTINDKAFVSDYGNRREIFGFSEDGVLFQALTELFLYNNEVYLTTVFVGDEDTKKEQILMGVRIPDEWQEMFQKNWQ